MLKSFIGIYGNKLQPESLIISFEISDLLFENKSINTFYLGRMRKELAAEKGKRKKFKAVFSRVGKKVNNNGYSEETVLLKNIVDVETSKQVADHVWFSYTQGFVKEALMAGDSLEFEARVKEYHKGYVNKNYKINNRTTDFKLSYPTKFKKLTR